MATSPPLPRILAAACLLAWALVPSPARAALLLTQAPVGMKKQNQDIAIAWTGGTGRVHLRASTAPGNGSIAHYDSLHLANQPAEGSLTFRINPDIPSAYRNTDLRLGVNYCIVTDGTQSSPEFMIIVESSVAPQLSSPANAASIKDLTPTFSWTGDAPYYAVLVSDEPFKITEEGTVSGVSAIWQIITPFTTARYGEADPSGFNSVAAPPLISGKTYNWLVLNNYGNNAGATSKVAPVPASFVYLPAPPLPEAGLISPADRDTVPGSDMLDFRWSLVDGAVSYKLEVLEENLIDGSQADVILWKASSTSGQIRLENASGILRRFNYKWRVYAVGNNGSASVSVKRSFFYAIEVGKLSVVLSNEKGQKLPYVPIRINKVGGSSSAVFQNGSTDGDGLLSIENAPLGNYEARIENVDGYQPKTDTIVHDKTGETSRSMVLKPVLGKVIGKVSVAGTGLLNARVKVSASDGQEWSVLTNSQGNYSLGVPFGNWQVAANAEGHLPGKAVTLSLNSADPAKTADFSLEPLRFTLSGRVLNSFNQQGIYGTAVYLGQGEATRTANTDGNGAWSFPVAPGTYSLRASSAGFASPEPVTLTVDGDRTLNLSLDPNASILSGRARDYSGTGLGGILAAATPKYGPTRSVVTDAQGYFELSLPAGDWILTASAKGYSSRTTHKFLLDVSKTVQGVDFQLEPNRSFLAGRVTENGLGLAGARVQASEASGLTDNAGYYLFAVGAGTHAVTAQKEGFLISRTYQVPINPGDTASGIDFTATGNAGVIKGKALSGGVGVIGARVEAVNQANKEAFQAVTDGDGAFALSLPGGAYVITASKEGFALDQAMDQVLSPGGVVLDANLRLVLDQGGISGTATSGSAALGGCEIAYRHPVNAGLSGRTVTDPQGRYSLSLQAGSAYVLAAACAGYQGTSTTSGTLARGASLVVDFSLAKAGSVLKGKVLDAKGALARVNVTAERNGEAVSTTSDFSGAWQLSLGSGTYSLSLSKSGYRTLAAQAQLAPGENARAADTLASATGRLSGRTLSEGMPLAGTLVTVVGLTPDAGGGVFQTDADGRFAVDNLPAGGYSLAASAAGHSEGRLASLTVVAGELTTAEVSLAPDRGVLSGTVEISGASPATVKVVANAYGVSRSAVPAANGAWTLDKLPGGNYAVSASLSGYSADSAWSGLPLGATATRTGINFRMTRNAGSLSGTVTGAGVATGIRVNLEGSKGTRSYGACDAAGRYSIPSLPEDTYTLTMTAPGFRMVGADQAPKFAVSAAATRDIALEAAVFRVAGKVVNQTGLAIAGIPIELRHPTGRVKATTGADGSFAFADVPAGGEYQVSFKPPTADYDPKDTVFARSLAETAPATVNLATRSRLASLAGTALFDGVAAEGVQIRLTGPFNDIMTLSQPGGAFKIPGIAGSDSALTLTAGKAGAGTFDTAVSVKVVENRTGFTLRLRTLKVALSGTLLDSDGKAVAGGKLVLSGGNRPDTLTANASGAFSKADLAANQTLSLATLLDKDRYDNVEATVRLREKDTAVALSAPVHASTVAVQVKDQAGAAVDGAEVTMNGKSMGFTVAGGLTVRNLAKGAYRFAAGKASYRGSPEAALDLSGDTSASLSLTVSQVTGGLFGSISDTGLAGGLPARKLAGAVVRAADGADTLADTANSLGQYFVDGLVDGRAYDLTVILPGYRVFLKSVTGSAQAQGLDIRLLPDSGAVMGRVSSGKAGVSVRLAHAAGGRILTSATVAGGYYGFLGLQNRSDYLVQAWDSVLASAPVTFQALGGAARRVDLALEEAGSLAGRTAGVAAGALAGVRVEARNVVTGASAWTLSDASGNWSLRGLASGEYRIAAERIGFRAPPPRQASAAKGKATTGIDLSLEEADAGLTGLVLDKAGRAVPGALSLAKGSDTLRVTAGGGGQFLIPGLAAGNYAFITGVAGYTHEAAAIDYSGKGLALANLSLTRTANRMLGAVRDAITNTPVAGATVKLLPPLTGEGVADASGRYVLALPDGAGPAVLVEVSKEGYLTRTGLPVFRDADGSVAQDFGITADYKLDGEIRVTVKEGKDLLEGLILALEPFHPDDSPKPGLSGQAPFAFRNLRRPAPYTVKARRSGLKDLSRFVELDASAASLDVVLSYPTSQIRVFVTADGRRGKGVEVSLDGQRIAESADTAGLYLSSSKLKPSRYEVTLQDPDTSLLPMASHHIALGEDSVRTDTLFSSFLRAAIPDSVIDTAFEVNLARLDSLKPAAGAVAKIFYRPEGASLWDSLVLDSVAGGFAKLLPAQGRAGTYQYYSRVTSPAGIRVGVAGAAGDSRGTAPAVYSNSQTPSTFRLRDPFLLQAMALLPQRLEADTSLYSLGARDLWQVQVRGENGRSLDAHFDRRAAAGDTAFSVSWAFADDAAALSLGLSLEADPANPRLCRFRGGLVAYDSAMEVRCLLRMGSVRLRKSFLIKVQDLAPVSIGIRYVKENRALEQDGATLLLSNNLPAGHAFAAFATTADGRTFNILPRWSLGSDSAAGTLSQQGVFVPDPSVARSAVLRIADTLTTGGSGSSNRAGRAFSFEANLATYAQVVPAATGSAVVTNGEGTWLGFNLAGLAKAFTVSVKKPKVSGLLRASPKEEVVGEILDIELSESQPFKADSGAVLRMPVASGIARRSTVYLGHWNTARLSWERVAEAKADSLVQGKVYGFSKYAVLMGSLPLGAYDLVAKPNPFTAHDPWGLQLGYKVSSDVSSQVVVRVEVFNMMGDKVYESQEVQLSKGQSIDPGTHKADPKSSQRRTSLGPFVWDGRDTKGVLCRNGRYLLKLIVKDGQGSKEYLKKVVMLK